MLILFFLVKNPIGETHSLTYWGESIEDCFECLNALVQGKWKLLDAQLMENGKRISLPIEAFDGFSMDKPLRQLSQEWQTILSEST
ncbi:hypothetical protein [Spirosoma oryzicola]|uniref:hypothetical protein n=1 Tax=Spirosoma oryzicola TaxID=2898794 RepID=UPI001E65627E|nr:hypothetical protein [Spirosoma oryzicola]UHG93256.1 hypothetical protein LQ777_10225 [Spirosoma oryzicola]